MIEHHQISLIIGLEVPNVPASEFLPPRQGARMDG
jgi:hypothetical protein